MGSPLSAAELLDQQFLPLRAGLLEIAAATDRLRRAEGQLQHDPRMRQVRQALAVLAGDEPDQAERVQRIFSLPYDAEWRVKFATAR